MGKDKLKRFAEMRNWGNVFQPSVEFLLHNDFELKGKWSDYFGNKNPIVLELGCGKGEYALGLASFFPHKNFIGIDRKGARLWGGAKTALANQLNNIAFIRGNIEFIQQLFGYNEVSEIWITFPDPYPRPSDSKNRLSSSKFLNHYKKFLMPDGIIHLKTDNELLFDYTLRLLKLNNITPLVCSNNIELSHPEDELLSILTHYENQFRQAGIPIKFLSFQFNNNQAVIELDKEEQVNLATLHEEWKKPVILKPRLP